MISLGYRYFLSRTTIIQGEDADICITLVPVKKIPVLKKLPDNFDTFFSIGAEPRQMAKGVDETIILVDFSNIDIYAKQTIE